MQSVSCGDSLETVCMKFQNLLSEKNKKNSSVCLLLKIVSRVLRLRFLWWGSATITSSSPSQRKRKQTKSNKRKSNKGRKSTKISSLFPKRGNCNPKRTEKHCKNKITIEGDLVRSVPCCVHWCIFQKVFTWRCWYLVNVTNLWTWISWGTVTLLSKL